MKRHAGAKQRTVWVTLIGGVVGLLTMTPSVTQSQQTIFGPKQYLRTAGPPNMYTDTFPLPAGVTAPFLLHIVNGNADGTNRVSSATGTVNGTQVAGPSDFNQNVGVIDRTVTLQAANTLDVRLTSAPGSFLTLTVQTVPGGPQPTALTPNPLNLTAGATGTLTATLAPAPTSAGSLVVTSSNPAVATVPATVPIAATQTSVPFTVTAVAAGTATVTVTLNGVSAASQVTVVPPAPTVTGFTPTSGAVGEPVTVTGTNFINVQAVTFNGVAAVDFTVQSDTTLTAVVPAGATTGKIAVTTAAGTGQSTADFTVKNPVPILTGLTPTAAPAGSPDVALTVTGQQFVPGAAVTFGATTLATTVVSATHLTVTIPGALLATKGTVPVTAGNPAPGGGISNSLPFTIQNRPPQLAPIGNHTVPLGSTLTFTVTATDPDHDPVTFAVTPLPLPAHAAFNAQTGVFTFTPDATQVGDVTLTVFASDGEATASETVTITVTGAPAGGVTAVTGRVDDTSQHPLANVPVTLRGTTLTTTTDAQGVFTLLSAGMPTGRQHLIVDGLAQNFALLVAPVDLIPNVTNQLPQALTIPPLDTATAVTVNPAATTVLASASLNVTVTIPPGAAKHPDGTPYTGQLTLSPVPEYGRPESRPVELRPGLSVTIQPAGIVMDPPVPITSTFI